MSRLPGEAGRLRPRLSAQIRQESPGLLHGPGSSGLAAIVDDHEIPRRRDSEDVRVAAARFHDEQAGKTLQGYRAIYVQESVASMVEPLVRVLRPRLPGPIPARLPHSPGLGESPAYRDQASQFQELNFAVHLSGEISLGFGVQAPPRTQKPVRSPQNWHRLNTRRAAGHRGRPGSRPRSRLLPGRQP